MRKFVVLSVVAGTASLFISTAAQAATGTWIGPTNGNWSDTTHWQDGVVPNAQGDTAQYIADSGSQITLVDVVGGVRVGTLKVASTTNISWQIRPVNDVIMDQDGYAGPGRASIINDIHSTTTTTNPAIFINSNTGWLTLNDDLFISNTSNSTRTSGAIQMQSKIQGNGNIWIENVSNDIGHGQVAFTGQGNYGGSTTIAKGALTFTRGDIFTPGPGNFVYIGSTGGGDATLAGVGGGVGNIENNFVAVAGSGGTLIFASNPSNNSNMNIKSTNTNASAIRLDGDLSFDNRATNGSVFVIGDPITGVGKLTKIGVGAMRVTHTNSYSGGTVVDAGSLSVGWAAPNDNGFGHYDATIGALGPGNVTVNSTATYLQIEAGASTNAIADTATLSLGGGGTPDAADQGYALLDAGINEVVGGLMLGGVAQTTAGTYGSTLSSATFQNDEYFSGTGVITLASVGLPGDYNADGKVDSADYVAWRKTPGNFGGDPAGYNTWRTNFGNGAPGAGSGLSHVSQAVPEPATMLLLAMGALVLCAGRRDR
jgi:autotransporter-associated beta strand protein